jgi:hypothetical protein
MGRNGSFDHNPYYHLKTKALLDFFPNLFNKSGKIQTGPIG